MVSPRYVFKYALPVGKRSRRTTRYSLSIFVIPALGPSTLLDMEIRHLSSLIAIADHGSFSAASRALGTVQSMFLPIFHALKKSWEQSLLSAPAESSPMTEKSLSNEPGELFMNLKTSRQTFSQQTLKSKEILALALLELPDDG